MSITRRTALTGTMLALAPIPAAAAETGDAELLRLGDAFEEAWSRERLLFEAGEPFDPDWELAYEATSKITDQIEAIPAHTMSGLRVKARVVAWCQGLRSDEPVDLRVDQDTKDCRLANSIIATLLNIGGGAS